MQPDFHHGLFRRDVLLTLHIRRSDNLPEPLHPSHRRVLLSGAYCLAAAVAVFALPNSLSAALNPAASLSAGPVPQ